MAVTTYFDPYSNVKDGKYRRELYEKAIESIRKTNWGSRKACLVLCDDHSQEPPEAPEAGIPAYLFVSPTHLGVQVNTKRAIEKAIQLAEWVLVFDSDAIVRPDWIAKTFEMIERFPEATGFNLFNSRYHKSIAKVNEYVIKDDTQGCGLLFRSDRYVPACDDCPWEECVMFMRMAHGGKYVVPERSLMNHLGEYGLSNNGECHDFDPAF